MTVTLAAHTCVCVRVCVCVCAVCQGPGTHTHTHDFANRQSPWAEVAKNGSGGGACVAGVSTAGTSPRSHGQPER